MIEKLPTTVTCALVGCLLLASLAGCDDDDSSSQDTADTAVQSDTGADSDAAAAPDQGFDTLEDTTSDGAVDVSDETPTPDTVPPQIREIQGTLGEAGAIDLRTESELRYILEDTPLSLVIFTTDDVVDSDALLVGVLDISDPEAPTDVTIDSATFSAGLWTVEVTASPGYVLAVTVSDGSNVVQWEHTLAFPSRLEASARDWTDLIYNDSQELVERLDVLFADGVFCEEQMDGYEGGSYDVVEGQLVREFRHETACDTEPESGEWDTIELEVRGDFYVDGTYLAHHPFNTDDEGDTSPLSGSWTATWTTSDGDVALTHSDAFVFTSNTDTTGTFARVESVTEGDAVSLVSRSGSFETIINESYEENFGDFITLTYDTLNGEDIEPYDNVSFYTSAGDHLLIDPYVDLE